MTFRKRFGPMERRISQAQATTFFVDNRTSTKLVSAERSAEWPLQHPKRLSRRLPATNRVSIPQCQRKPMPPVSRSSLDPHYLYTLEKSMSYTFVAMHRYQ